MLLLPIPPLAKLNQKLILTLDMRGLAASSFPSKTKLGSESAFGK
jgi:hypothetical protein